MRITGAGYLLFASTLIALGLLGLIQGDFTAIWQPVPPDLPLRTPLAYLCAIVCLAGGAGLLHERVDSHAARLLSAAFLLWILSFKLPAILRAPMSTDAWENCAETAVIVSAAVAFLGRLAIARVLYGVGMIVFGLAHFAYLKETASLVPGWLPAPTLWAGFTGAAYIAAGLSILSGVQARLAAMLSAVQMGAFTLLVWIPIIAAPGPKTAFQWSETMLSWVLTLAGWVMADSYDAAGMPRPMIALQSALRGKAP